MTLSPDQIALSKIRKAMTQFRKDPLSDDLTKEELIEILTKINNLTKAKL